MKTETISSGIGCLAGAIWMGSVLLLAITLHHRFYPVNSQCGLYVVVDMGLTFMAGCLGAGIGNLSSRAKSHLHASALGAVPPIAFFVVLESVEMFVSLEPRMSSLLSRCLYFAPLIVLGASTGFVSYVIAGLMQDKSPSQPITDGDRACDIV